MSKKQVSDKEKLKKDFISLLKNRNTGIENSRLTMRTSLVSTKSFDSTKDYSFYVEKILFEPRSNYSLDTHLENLLLTFFLQTTPADFKKYYLTNNLTKERDWAYDNKMKALINNVSNNKWDTKKDYFLTLVTHGLLLSRKNFIKDYVLPNIEMLNNSQKLLIFDKAITLKANDNIDVHTVLNTLLNTVKNPKEVGERRGLLTNIVYADIDVNLFEEESRYETYKLIYSIVKLNSINLNKNYDVNELNNSIRRLGKEFENFKVEFGLKNVEGVEIRSNDKILSLFFHGNNINTVLIKKVFENSLREILLLNEVVYDSQVFNTIINKNYKLENAIIIKESLDNISLSTNNTKKKL